MKYYVFFIVLLTICSCNYNKKMTPISNRHDTIITYDIDNLSSEGAETHVLYKGGKIKEKYCIRIWCRWKNGD